MRWIDRFDRRNHDRDDRRSGRNLLLPAGLMFAVCAVLASLAPAPLLAAVMSSLTSIAASVAAVTALVSGEAITWTAFNRWDVALGFLALSIAAGWLIDPEAVAAFVEAQAAASPAQ